MNGKRRVNSDQTKVKYAKSEKISLVTGDQVTQFHADVDRDSYKVERCRLFQNNPTPQHHTRYLPEPRAYQRQAKKKSNFCGLKSKSKRLLSYCLIYVLMFACAITLLYLFYTPKQMNLFGFYSSSNLRLKFYRFVLGRNASTTITPKIITTTEPTIFITHSTTSTSSTGSPTIKTKPFLPRTDTKASSTTQKPMVMVKPQVTTVRSEPDSPVSSSTASSVKENDDEDHKMETKKEPETEPDRSKSITTCKPINVTEPTQPSTVKVSSTALPVSSTAKPKAKTTAKPSKMDSPTKKSTTTSTTTQPTTTLPKDNLTETSEFKEKISYSGSQLNADKNDTIDDETVVDNGVLPTEEEEEEKRKDELESKQKIASFFGVDPVTGKEKDDKLNPLISERQSPRGKSYNLESDSMTRSVVNADPPPKQSNKWFLGNQPFARGDYGQPAANNKPKDEFIYHPMLKLLYRNCYGNCS